MAMYKVPQDVEADDKFLGPLSFKQFLFGGAAIVLGYIMFFTVTKGMYYFTILFAPFFIFFGALAFPWSKEQPTELWLASRIRFMLVPHKRIWDQSGMKELVQITVPKREAHIYTDGLSQSQVRSRVYALANVVDTRGWAIKNLTTAVEAEQRESDRLITAQTNQDEISNKAIVEDTDDIMDESSNPLAQQFNDMMAKSESRHRQEVVNTFKQQVAQPSGAQNTQASPEDMWFLREQPQNLDPNLVNFQQPASVSPGQSMAASAAMQTQTSQVSAEEEQRLLQQIRERKTREQMLQSQSHMRVIKPLDESVNMPMELVGQPSPQPAIPVQTSPDPLQRTASLPPVDPAILSLASNDDLSVETLARQATAAKEVRKDDGEVIVSLH